MLTLLSLFVATPAAHAVPDGWEGPEYEQMCSKTCDRGGYRIKVMKKIDGTAQRLEFIPTTVTHTVDYDHKVVGDTFIGHQDATFANLAGGPYCRNFPGSGGTYILGAVYEHYEYSSWDHEETDDLWTTANYCDASIPFLLSVLDLYGIGGDALPTSCADKACVSGTGGGGDDDDGPGGNPWVYTDASGQEQPFEDLFGNPGSSGTGGGIDLDLDSMDAGPQDLADQYSDGIWDEQSAAHDEIAAPNDGDDDDDSGTSHQQAFRGN